MESEVVLDVSDCDSDIAGEFKFHSPTSNLRGLTYVLEYNLNQSDLLLATQHRVQIRRIDLEDTNLKYINKIIWSTYSGNIIFNSPIIKILHIFLSLTISIFAALPYWKYAAGLPDIIWVFFCVTRTIIYFTIFSGYWLYSFIDCKLFMALDKSNISYMYIIRQLVSVSFAVAYSFMYSIKWYALEDIPLYIPSIVLFSICWTFVFYSVVSKLLSSLISISGLPSTGTSMHERTTLLKSVKLLETYILASSENSDLIYNQLTNEPNISLLFVATSTNNESERLSIYDEITYSPCENVRASAVNIFLGVCLIPLVCSMMQDYGHSLAQLLQYNNTEAGTKIISEAGFLWLIVSLSTCISMMYTLAIHPIPHKYINKLSNLKIKELIKGCLLNIPILVCGCILASIRMNATYLILDKFVGKYALPYVVGISIIWLGVMLVFLIDFFASVKIISCAWKKYFTLFSFLIKTICETNCILHWLQFYRIRCYTKSIKWFIRNCNEDIIHEMFVHLL